MSDETQRPVEMKTAIKASSVGSPMVALADENVNRMLLGRVIGYAFTVSTAQIEDRLSGEMKTLKSLKGSFEAIPYDVNKPIVRSAKLQLPEHILAGVIDYMEGSGETGEVISVGFELGVERAKNAAGYSWFARPLIDLGTADPLLKLRGELAGPAGAPALPAGEAAKVDQAPREAETEHARVKRK